HYLKDKPLDLPEALTFEAGANRWVRSDAWPPRTSRARDLYFGPAGRLSFERPPLERAPSAFDSYVSDPAHPVPYRNRPIEPTYYPKGSGWYTWLLQDQRFVQSRPDVLSWETESLEADVTVRGPIVAHLFAATTGSDGDWIVKAIASWSRYRARGSRSSIGTRRPMSRTSSSPRIRTIGRRRTASTGRRATPRISHWPWPHRDQALLGGRRRPADARLPRRGMGRPAARRPRSVREARARRLPGRPLLARHPAQARALPRGVRRVRPGADGPLRSQEDRAASAGSRDRPQSPEGECRDRQRPRVPQVSGGRRLVWRLSLGLCGRSAEAIPAARGARSSRPLPGVGRDERGARTAGLPLRRT